MDAQTHTLRWSVHRPIRGWYLRLRSPLFPPASAINVAPGPADGTLEFACRTNVDMRRCIPPPPNNPHSNTSGSGDQAVVHSYPPQPASASSASPTSSATSTTGFNIGQNTPRWGPTRSNTAPPRALARDSRSSDSSVSSSSTAVSLPPSRPPSAHGLPPASSAVVSAPRILVTAPVESGVKRSKVVHEASPPPPVPKSVPAPAPSAPGESEKNAGSSQTKNQDQGAGSSTRPPAPPAPPKVEITNFVLTPRPHLPLPSAQSQGSGSALSSSASGVFSVLTSPRAPSFIASAIQSILPPRKSFTLHTPSLPPLITFHDTSPYLGTQTRGTILFDTGVARVLGVDESFWIAVGCAYLEYLGERESYMAAADG
ncbi:hypothetical protein BOTBODRAFT_30773 [Botryobasidium botryosum FD-172 SS1]|uniref:Uncharacterized protein n=1 Tax=Botryobasidium botryosum (strain FD-172 SS1) TaxID=930990 RepID=A0A067ML02_BOTB1|nr:hypothetical protein BOTBODRAFT_30773 [Botryobasidium botryosum FD-172 SS1]